MQASTAAIATKQCSACGERKSLAEFYFNRRFQRHFARCKPCQSAYTLERYHERNPGTEARKAKRDASRRAQLETPPDVTSPNTRERGLGWQHQLQRERLIEALAEGEPCWWCGQELHASASDNWDGRSLEADHSVPRAHGGIIADRLLHMRCNRARGNGERDHVRPAVAQHRET